MLSSLLVSDYPFFFFGIASLEGIAFTAREYVASAGAYLRNEEVNRAKIELERREMILTGKIRRQKTRHTTAVGNLRNAVPPVAVAGIENYIAAAVNTALEAAFDPAQLAQVGAAVGAVIAGPQAATPAVIVEAIGGAAPVINPNNRTLARGTTAAAIAARKPRANVASITKDIVGTVPNITPEELGRSVMAGREEEVSPAITMAHMRAAFPNASAATLAAALKRCYVAIPDVNILNAAISGNMPDTPPGVSMAALAATTAALDGADADQLTNAAQAVAGNPLAAASAPADIVRAVVAAVPTAWGNPGDILAAITDSFHAITDLALVNAAIAEARGVRTRYGGTVRRAFARRVLTLDDQSEEDEQ
jgi:hypothetical protein